MNPNSPEQPSPSTESVRTEWDNISIPDNIEQNTNTSGLEEFISFDFPPEDEDWKTQAEIVRQLEGQVGRRKVRETINKLTDANQIKGKTFKDRNANNQPHAFYSEEEQSKIFAELEEFPPEDEDWKTQAEIVRQLEGQVGKERVGKTIRELTDANQIKGKSFKVRNANNQPRTFYSEEEQSKIFAKLEEFISFDFPPEDEDWKTQAEIVRQLEGQVGENKVGKTIRELTDANQIKGKTFKDRNANNRPGTFYSEEEQSKIFAKLEEFISFDFPPEDEDWKTQAEIVRQLEGQVGEKKVGKTIRELTDANQIKGKTFKDRNANNQPHAFYSEEEQSKIFAELEEFPPEDEDWKTQAEIVRQLEGQVGKERVGKTIRELKDANQIKGKTFKDRNDSNQPHAFYSEEEQSKIFAKLEEFISFNFPPEDEDWKTQAEIVRQLEGQVGKKKVGKTIRELTDANQIKGKTFKDRNANNQPHAFYSEEEQSKIFAELEEFPPEDEDWKTQAEIVRQLEGQVGKKKVGKTIRELTDANQIKGKTFKDRNANNQPLTFYSEEEQSKIFAEIEKSAPRGTSFPECAIAFYLQQAGINILQWQRPDWMKNPDTGKNLEIDILVISDDSPLQIGIEYDGYKHTDPEADENKNRLSRQHGIEIIHIRQHDLPKLSDDIPCIIRQNNQDKYLAEPIEQLFAMLSTFLGRPIPLPEAGIDIIRDKKEISNLMNRNRTIQTFDGITEDMIDEAA